MEHATPGNSFLTSQQAVLVFKDDRSCLSVQSLIDSFGT